MFGRENQVNRNNVSEHECLKVEARQEHLHVFLLGCNVHPPYPNPMINLKLVKLPINQARWV